MIKTVKIKIQLAGCTLHNISPIINYFSVACRDISSDCAITIWIYKININKHRREKRLISRGHKYVASNREVNFIDTLSLLKAELTTSFDREVFNHWLMFDVKIN